jgi:hypothetical protein
MAVDGFSAPEALTHVGTMMCTCMPACSHSAHGSKSVTRMHSACTVNSKSMHTTANPHFAALPHCLFICILTHLHCAIIPNRICCLAVMLYGYDDPPNGACRWTCQAKLHHSASACLAPWHLLQSFLRGLPATPSTQCWPTRVHSHELRDSLQCSKPCERHSLTF